MEAEVFKTLHEHFVELRRVEINETENAETRLSENEMLVILEDISSRMDNVLKDSPDEYANRLKGMKAAVLHEIAKCHQSLNNLEKAEEVSQTVLTILNGKESFPEAILTSLKTYNILACLFFQKENLEEPRNHLELAHSLYRQYTDKGRTETPAPYTIDDLFSVEEKPVPPQSNIKIMEHLFIEMIQVLSYVYYRADDLDMFARYYHEVLKKQLVDIEMEDISWAVRTARLAVFFITKNRFNDALHHLAAATALTERYESKLKTMENSPEINAKWAEFLRRGYEITRCWTRYALMLLGESRARMVAADYGHVGPWDPEPIVDTFKEEERNEIAIKLKDERKRNMASPSVAPFFFANYANQHSSTSTGRHPYSSITSSWKHPVNVKRGTSDADEQNSSSQQKEHEVEASQPVETPQPDITLRFDIEGIDAFEKDVPSTLVTTLEEAERVFNLGNTWLKRARTMLPLRENPVEHMYVTIDRSDLYRNLMSFQKDLDSEYALQVKRCKILENFTSYIQQLRPASYIEIRLELLRELTEVHLEMMAANMRRLYNEEPPIGAAPVAEKIEIMSNLQERLDRLCADLFRMDVQSDSTDSDSESDSDSDIEEDDDDEKEKESTEEGTANETEETETAKETDDEPMKDEAKEVESEVGSEVQSESLAE